MKPDQSTDDFSLEVTAAFTRFLNEARRLPSANAAHETAWEVLKVALFENGLSPAIRLEMLKEDASKNYTTSRARAKKHFAHLNVQSPASVSSVHAAAPASSNVQIESQVQHLTDALRDLQKTVHTNTSSATTPYAAVAAVHTQQQLPSNSRPGKRPARSSSASGKRQRRGSAPPKPMLAQAVTAAGASNSNSGHGRCKSPYCRDRYRNHETGQCQALKRFLALQRKGAFDSISSE